MCTGLIYMSNGAVIQGEMRKKTTNETHDETKQFRPNEITKHNNSGRSTSVSVPCPEMSPQSLYFPPETVSDLESVLNKNN